MQVSDLIRYNHMVRGLYFDAMAKLPWSEVVADKGLSFDSMRNVFLHLTLVEDRWINYIIPDRFSQWVNPNFDDFQRHRLIEEIYATDKDQHRKVPKKALKRRIE